MNKETGGPAFPDPQDNWRSEKGMTLRDYFAAAMVSSGTVFKNGRPADTPEAVARQAYELADAMLKARQL
jgi:hypothetical protein